MCNSRKYPYLRHGMVFLRPHILLNFLALQNPPTPQEIPIPSVGGGGVWIFSETEQYISSALYPTVHNDN